MNLKSIRLSKTEGFPGGTSGKAPSCNAGDTGMSLGQEDPLEEMANHSHVLAWKIPRTAESDRLQPTGLHRVRHDGAMEHACTYIYVCVCVLCVCVFAEFN